MKENDEKKVQNQDEEILNKNAASNEAEELLGNSEVEAVEGGIQDENAQSPCLVCSSGLT